MSRYVVGGGGDGDPCFLTNLLEGVGVDADEVVDDSGSAFTALTCWLAGGGILHKEYGSTVKKQFEQVANPGLAAQWDDGKWRGMQSLPVVAV